MTARLDRYVAGIYLSCWVLAVVFFLGLFGVMDFFRNVGDLLDHARSTAAERPSSGSSTPARRRASSRRWRPS